MKVYDCSNSEARPANRGYGGTVENAVVTILKKYGPSCNIDFTDKPEEADLLFTNDVFPPGLPNRPKVKRMDGIFWQHPLKDRNTALNEAALEANKVIFISNFSKSSLEKLYPQVFRSLKSWTVVVNWVDDEIFYPSDRIFPKKPDKFVSVATSWARPEKRLNAILEFARLIPNQSLFLIGTLPENTELPPNVVSLGPMSQYRLAHTLREMDVMVNLSHRDACPKTVAEGLATGLPVVFADSGGVSEMVCGSGFWEGDGGGWWVSISDPCERVGAQITNLLAYDMELGVRNLFKNYRLYYQLPWHIKGRTQKLIQGYFKVFKEVINGH